jgi:hypothetical protein
MNMRWQRMLRTRTEFPMMKVGIRQATAAMILAGGMPLQGAARDYGDLDTRNFPPNGWHAYQWEDPSGWIELRAEEEGLRPDDPTLDVAKALTSLVGRYGNQRIRIRFPEGTWRFTGSCMIKKPGGGLILQGAGRDKTRFIMDTDEGVKSELSIDARSGAPSKYLRLAKAVRRGDQIIHLPSADALPLVPGQYLSVNDRCVVEADRDHPNGVCLFPRQLVRVKAVEGAQVSLDMRLGMEMANAEVRVFAMGEQCGIEKIHFTRLRNAPLETHNLRLSFVANGFVRDCGVEGLASGGIVLEQCRDVIVARNEVHEMFGNHGHGGLGDGIIVGINCTGVHVTENRLWNLRHHIILLAADHTVVAYNHLEPGFFHYGDLAQHNGWHGHNNLFEGNTGNEMTTDWARQTHQPTWFITYFRNRALSSIGSVNGHSASYALIGNEIEGKPGLPQTPITKYSKGKTGLLTAGTNEFYLAANRVAGMLEWGQWSATSRMPASLIYDQRPDFVDRWPLFGPR